MRTWQSCTRSQLLSPKATIASTSRTIRVRTLRAQRNIQQTPSLSNHKLLRKLRCSFGHTTSKYTSLRRWLLKSVSQLSRREWKKAGSRPSNRVSLHTGWDTSVASFIATRTPLAITQAATRSQRSISMSDSSKDRSSSKVRRRPHSNLLELSLRLMSARSR